MDEVLKINVTVEYPYEEDIKAHSHFYRNQAKRYAESKIKAKLNNYGVNTHVYKKHIQWSEPNTGIVVGTVHVGANNKIIGKI